MLADTSSTDNLNSGQTERFIWDADDVDSVIRDNIDNIIKSSDQSIVGNIVRGCKANPKNVPREFDSPAFGRIKTRLSRELNADEKRLFRTIAKEVLGSMLSS